jgi:hypothetical protein
VKQPVHTSALLMRLMKEHRRILSISTGFSATYSNALSGFYCSCWRWAFSSKGLVLSRVLPSPFRSSRWCLTVIARCFRASSPNVHLRRNALPNGRNALCPLLRFVERVISFSGQHLSTGNRGRCPRLPVVSQCGESCPNPLCHPPLSPQAAARADHDRTMEQSGCHRESGVDTREFEGRYAGFRRCEKLSVSSSKRCGPPGKNSGPRWCGARGGPGIAPYEAAEKIRRRLQGREKQGDDADRSRNGHEV